MTATRSSAPASIDRREQVFLFKSLIHDPWISRTTFRKKYSTGASRRRHNQCGLVLHFPATPSMCTCCVRGPADLAPHTQRILHSMYACHSTLSRIFWASNLSYLKQVFSTYRIHQFLSLRRAGCGTIDLAFELFAEDVGLASEDQLRSQNSTIYPHREQHLVAVLEKSIAEPLSRAEVVRDVRRYSRTICPVKKCRLHANSLKEEIVPTRFRGARISDGRARPARHVLQCESSRGLRKLYPLEPSEYWWQLEEQLSQELDGIDTIFGNLMAPLSSWPLMDQDQLPVQARRNPNVALHGGPTPRRGGARSEKKKINFHLVEYIIELNPGMASYKYSLQELNKAQSRVYLLHASHAITSITGYNLYAASWPPRLADTAV
ncbi:unnamed protein product [Trichogramma brassicae]|uniref:Uncharacterized protein n=1 Tax=Trichogramma brassicae TaxID=86971 RepID=A0A6H5IS63_9HYME|nr:unnamed protein product [Trichogramma brassicae]